MLKGLLLNICYVDIWACGLWGANMGAKSQVDARRAARAS